jgi:membrane protein required for colicin V production
MNLNWLDIVILVIFAISVGSGAWKGFARIGIGAAATVLGILLAMWFYGTVGSIFLPYVAARQIANFIGFMAILVIVSAAGSLLGRLLAFVFKKIGLGWLDRLLGAAIGFVRALLVAIALVMILVAFTIKPPARSVVESQLAPYVLDAARVLAAIAPHEISDGFTKGYQKIRERWAQAVKTGGRLLEQ